MDIHKSVTDMLDAQRLIMINGLDIEKIQKQSERAKIENPDYDWSDVERDTE